jgi:hypothetical protein
MLGLRQKLSLGFGGLLLTFAKKKTSPCFKDIFPDRAISHENRV